MTCEDTPAKFSQKKGQPSFRQIPKKIGLFLIRAYQRFPIKLASCKYTPTCSEYTFEAVERYGLWRGSKLGFKRILRCNPLSHGGFDPVPDLEKSDKSEHNVSL